MVNSLSGVNHAREEAYIQCEGLAECLRVTGVSEAWEHPRAAKILQKCHLMMPAIIIKRELHTAFYIRGYLSNSQQLTEELKKYPGGIVSPVSIVI